MYYEKLINNIYFFGDNFIESGIRNLTKEKTYHLCQNRTTLLDTNEL